MIAKQLGYEWQEQRTYLTVGTSWQVAVLGNVMKLGSTIP